MSLNLEKIEHHLDKLFGKPRAGIRKWMKNQRNRKIRRAKDPKDIKYKGWEY